MKEGITLKQTDEAKLERSREILETLKEARGGKLLDSHRVMGNDPNLINILSAVCKLQQKRHLYS